MMHHINIGGNLVKIDINNKVDFNKYINMDTKGYFWDGTSIECDPTEYPIKLIYTEEEHVPALVEHKSMTYIMNNLPRIQLSN